VGIDSLNETRSQLNLPLSLETA